MKALTLDASGTLVPVPVTNPLYGNLYGWVSGIAHGDMDGLYLKVGTGYCGPGSIGLQYSNITHVLTMLHPWSMAPDCSSYANINLTVTPAQIITPP